MLALEFRKSMALPLPLLKHYMYRHSWQLPWRSPGVGAAVVAIKAETRSLLFSHPLQAVTEYIGTDTIALGWYSQLPC